MESFKMYDIHAKIFKELAETVSNKKRFGRPTSSIGSPEVNNFRDYVPDNQFIKNIRPGNLVLICKDCKKPKASYVYIPNMGKCDCAVIKDFQEKKYNQSKTGVILKPSVYIKPQKKLPGRTLNLRNFSSLNKKADLAAFEAFKSTETLSSQIRENLFSTMKSKPRDDISKYKYLIYKGNNSSIIKKLMDLRSNWCEGFFSLPSSANFIWTPTSQQIRFERQKTSCNLQFVNHFEYHTELSNKSKIYTNICNYSINNKAVLNSIVPQTFVIEFKNNDYLAQVQKFKVFMINIASKNLPNTHFAGKNIWIIKPAGCNRGQGINVFNDPDTLDRHIKDILSTKSPGSPTVYIIQKYIERPLLIQSRKFDIRVWVLITNTENCFFFPQGYLRTSSEKFTLDSLDSKFVHLTNNAIQKNGTGYGKFEEGNQLSFKYFQDYLQANHGNTRLSSIVSIMKNQIVTSLMAVKGKLNVKGRQGCFEIFGYDFIIDAGFKPWLIEANTNPCLELSSPLLEQIIPRMLEEALELTIDIAFPSPKASLNTCKVIDLPPGNLWEFLVSLSSFPSLVVNGKNI